jgi:hypothetical protein
LQPAKVADPATPLLGFAVQVRMAPAGVVMVRVTELVPMVRFPPASWMATTGWVAKAVAPVDADGFVVKASFAAAPKMLKLALVAVMSPVAVAVSV